MGLGIPVVSSPVGVNKEIVDNDKNGFLANSEKEWFDCISQLIENKSKRSLLGDNGREKIKQYYDIKLNVIKIVKFYRKTFSKNI